MMGPIDETMPGAGEATEIVEVVVVGAGLSGLVAARELRRHGADVIVLEAADRIGGRTMSVSSALGSRVDLGGQWIGHDHHRARELALGLGLNPFPMHTGRLPAVLDGARGRRAAPSMVTTGVVLAAMGAIARVGTPRRWDTVSLRRALAMVPGRRARRLLEVIVLISWTADPDRLSVRAAAELIRKQGGLKTMLSTAGGAQDGLVVEGVGTMAELLAEELGSRVRCGQPVVSLHRDRDGVTVRLPSHAVRATEVIVTLPPPTAARIDHLPALPEDRARVERSTFLGSVYKAVAVYERPWWRDMGSAELIALGAPACAVFDSSPPDGPGHLTILVGGAEARALDGLDADERRAAVLRPIADHLGREVLHPSSWHDKAWHLDEHAGGGYVALPELGAAGPAWPMPREAVGHVHWAGSETADDHPGYLDGAIEAGRRAALEVVAALR